MSLTNEQAEYFLDLPKKIVQGDKILDRFTIDQAMPFNQRYELVSEVDSDCTFIWIINQSAKNSIRVSLHYQDNDSKTGLVRIDYNGGHRNPSSITDALPDMFHPYVGKQFKNHEHHIHYHVEGYPSLAWAIPLIDDEFEIKELDDNPQFYATFARIIQLFAKTVNIETKLDINTLLL